MKKYAIVGFGCAGYYAAKTLREHDKECKIDVFSDTDAAPANPVLTTYYVGGRIPREQVYPFDTLENILEDLKINYYPNQPVDKLLAQKRVLCFTDGSQKQYDDIILATGSYALVPPIPGKPKDNVYVMRTIQDADQLLEDVKGGLSSVLVIGASWVGIKVIEALHAHQVELTLADLAPRIFPTATFPETAEILHGYLEDLGIRLLFGRGISSFEETEDGIVSTFSDGSQIKTQAVALCMGVRPNIPYVDRDEIKVGRGIQVDEYMRTNVPHIYAAGDCCETMEIVAKTYMPVSLWANAVDQGRIAAHHILGVEEKFEGAFAHNITRALGFDFVGLGDPRLPGEWIVRGDGTVKDDLRIVVKDGQMQCVNILGNYRLSGSLKNWFVMQRKNPHVVMPDLMRANLLREGVDKELLEKIGGGIQ